VDLEAHDAQDQAIMEKKMQITCSGSHYLEPIETSACLDCALSKQNTCGYGYRILKAIFSTQENDQRKNEVHVTDITGCLLKSYLDKKRAAPPYVHDLLYLFIGIAVHSALDFTDEHVQSEVEIHESGLRGRADAIFKDTLEDVKTTSAHLGAVIYEVPSVNMESYIDERVGQLSTCMANGTEPEAEPSFLCAYCAHESCIHNHKRGQ